MLTMTQLPQRVLDAYVAELEPYGLELRMINMLETRFDAVKIRDLLALSETELLAIPWVGRKKLGCLKAALRGFVDGEQ